MTDVDDDLLAFDDEIVVQLHAAELWDLLWRPEGQTTWLGPDAAVLLRRATRSVLVDEAGPWRVARCRGSHPHSRATFDVEPADRWTGTAPTEVTIAVRDDGDRAALTVSETGIAPPDLGDVDRYWSERLRRVDLLAREVRRRRRDVRQAVVVIHGIGEQQPGRTLEALAASGVLFPARDDESHAADVADVADDADAPDDTDDGDAGVDEAPAAWVKPDRLSDSFEVRRLTLRGDGETPSTDAYELYWAHLVRDTTLGQVGAWAGRLLLRWPVPRPLLPQWLVAWAAIVAVVVATLVAPTTPAVGASIGVAAVLAAGARLLWRTLGRSLATNVVGDAARYLRPRPENIAHRQAIRQEGVELLERLHQSGEYDRIVLVGHSLGSVIAYDVLTHLWIELNRDHQQPSSPSFKALRAVERAIGDDGIDAVEAQRLQHEAWQQQRENTQPWLVTDLVTLGSPLTYAEFLLVDDREMLERAKRDRVLPTCPPVTELERRSQHQRITYDESYVDGIDGHANRTFSVLHHGAPFAVTRWTNLWFAHRRLGLAGDLVGGPVAPQFGPWVRDVELHSPWPTFAHTRYWTPAADSDDHLAALREALGLDARRALRQVSVRIPAHAVVPAGRSTRIARRVAR